MKQDLLLPCQRPSSVLYSMYFMVLISCLFICCCFCEFTFMLFMVLSKYTECAPNDKENKV